MTNLGVVFPGQGSQAVGMLSALGEVYPIVRHTFEQASEILGLDLWRLVQNGPEDVLNQTVNTQPALLATGVAIWRVWCNQGGVKPTLMAGHSLGEYSALVCAEALEFTDGIRLVAERARLMQTAVPQGKGAMAALLGLDYAQVQTLCNEAAAGEIVAAANINAPGQIVIAGHTDAVDRACKLAKTAGAKRTPLLPVSVPSHCALMRPAADILAQYMQHIPIKSPQIKVLHNATVETTTDPERIRTLLAWQLYNPVRWVETVQSLVTQGITNLVEAGPSKVLTGLNKRIDNTVRTWPVFDPQTIDQALEEIARGA